MYKNMSENKTSNPVKVQESENGKKIIPSVRELYMQLGLNKTHYKRWCDKNIVNNKFFKENIDWRGFATMANGNQTIDYAISLEFGKHLCMMANTDKSHDIRNYFIKCEEALKNVVDNVLTEEQRLQLALIQANSTDELIRASANLDLYRKQQLQLKDEIIIKQNDKIKQDEPLVKLAIARLDRNGLISITDATKTFKLKKGYITKWAKFKGYLHKVSIEVNKVGEEFFKVYDSGGFKCIGISENGLKFINSQIDTIENQNYKNKKGGFKNV